MSTPTLLGASSQLMMKPVTQALRTNAGFQLEEDTRPNITQQLRDQSLSAALLSPLDYARDSSALCIIPDVAVVSRQTDSSIIIPFREGVKTIRTLAVDPAYASEIVLAKIILAESFDIEPRIVPIAAPFDVMMQKADAALLVGDQPFHAQYNSDRYIDIVEEWCVMTELPYVHAVWCGRESDLSKEDIMHIQNAAFKGVAGIGDIALEYPPEERSAVQHYLESFSYELTDEAREGLAEFMKYLYYHGILPDVAELNFYKTADEEKDDLLSDISSN